MLQRLFPPRGHSSRQDLTAFPSTSEMGSPSISSGETSLTDTRIDQQSAETAASFRPTAPETTLRANIDALSEDVADVALGSVCAPQSNSTNDSPITGVTYDDRGRVEKDRRFAMRPGDPVTPFPATSHSASLLSNPPHPFGSSRHPPLYDINSFTMRQISQMDGRKQAPEARDRGVGRALREVMMDSTHEMRRATEVIGRLTSELRGQQTELEIMAHKVRLKREMMLEIIDAIAAVAEDDPGSLRAELDEWRAVVVESDWITGVNDRSHEVGSLLSMASELSD
ncbi:hypothetical protein CTA2_9395 [Colletotrichum tanaceti]|uniref:Uncharacterized protein n=1 Tax=Colletotrichum tanaceti TaxID=1306861 RepID=A0A4U6XKZ2_9PEZI|nr:hypothetical protein CTA2_9395 [Colletotrichum tanaceti]TKW56274.1 hypothetical protein CTA1_11942 [Colletotrichum tanaceti]